MAQQLDIDFTNISRTQENNAESQAHLECNTKHFDRQCRLLLALLQQGARITCFDAMTKYSIGHLPRRVLDLRNRGIAVKGEYKRDPDGKRTRFKEYFL